MSVRDWLIVVGIVILLGVVADLVRRYLQRGKLRLAIDDQYKDLPEPDLSAELPNGGARVVSPDSHQGTPATGTKTSSEPEDKDAQAESDWKIDPILTGARAADEDVDLLLEQEFKGVGQGSDRWLASKATADQHEASHVVSQSEIESTETVPEPLPVEPAPEPISEETSKPEADSDTENSGPGIAELESEPQPIEPASATEPDAAPDRQEVAQLSVVEERSEAGADIDLERPVHELIQAQQAKQSLVSEVQPEPPAPIAPSADTALEEPTDELAQINPVQDQVQANPEPVQAISKPRQGLKEEQTSFFDLHPDLAPEPVSEKPKSKRRRKKAATKLKGRDKAAAAQSDETPLEEQVLVIHVQSKQQPFNGPLLYKLLDACGVEHGEMDIFHRHEEAEGQGSLQFSIANGVAPGTFEVQSAPEFTTPALTFFLRLIDPTDRMNAFECMLATAQCVADNLGGELKDENRSSLRSQTIEHYRQKVREFERKQLTRRA